MRCIVGVARDSFGKFDENPCKIIEVKCTKKYILSTSNMHVMYSGRKMLDRLSCVKLTALHRTWIAHTVCVRVRVCRCISLYLSIAHRTSIVGNARDR